VLQLTLETGFSLTTMFVVAAAAILLAGLFYYRAFKMLRRGQWQILLALRSVSILLVVLLLFRPVFSYYQNLQERPTLIFLIDASASMSISDDSGGVSRFNQAKSQLDKWWPQLTNDFQLNLMHFAERAAPLRSPKGLEGLAPDGKSTSLSTAMQAASQLVSKAENPTIILLSDGIHNSANNPVEIAGKLGVTVHTIGVGASLRNNLAYRDIQVTGIDCPDRLMLNNKAKVVGMVDAVGLEGRVVKVVLEEDDKQILEQELTLDNVEGSQRVEFEFRPTVKGRHSYTVRVPKLEEEKIAENNQRSAVATVAEPGLRVFYVEGTLRNEYGAIVDRFLAKDPDLEYCSLVQTRPNVFLKRSNIEGLDVKSIPSDAETINKFDVFIIGDLDSSYLKPEQQRLIAQRVRAGAGLVMLGGYHALGPGGYAGTPLGEILPAALGSRDIGQVNDPFLPLLTPDGARHPIFANIAGFFPTKTGSPRVAGLPDLNGCTRIEAAKPGATILAFHPTEANQMPVLAVQPIDKGRTAVFCGDTTRNWQQGPRALGKDSPFLRFWGQMVRWLAGRSAAVEAKASIVGATDKGYYEPEEPVRISAIVRDDKGEGTNAAKVVAKVTIAGKTEETPLAVAPGPGGHYAASYVPKRAGRYEIVVEARSGELTLQSDKLVLDAGRVNLEFEKLDMDEKLLAQIAAATKGRYFHITTASALIEQLDHSQQQKREYVKRPLYWPPGFWALFVGVLTVEWVLRRRFQLR
jgi:uncharacterized membrane protein